VAGMRQRARDELAHAGLILGDQDLCHGHLRDWRRK
jgi:hypothetical protein